MRRSIRWLTPLITVCAINASAAEWPEGVRVPAGAVSAQPMLCYDVERMKALAEYRAECVTFREEAEDCEKRLQAGAGVSAWYSSPWVWLAVGLAAGFGTSIAVTR